MKNDLKEFQSTVTDMGAPAYDCVGTCEATHLPGLYYVVDYSQENASCS